MGVFTTVTGRIIQGGGAEGHGGAALGEDGGFVLVDHGAGDGFGFHGAVGWFGGDLRFGFFERLLLDYL